MRAAALALILLALAVAGCLHAQERAPVRLREGTPLAEATWTASPRTVTEGPWTATMTPGNLSGAPGDVVSFRVRFDHEGAPLSSARVQPAGWTQFREADGTLSAHSRNVTDGSTFDAVVLLGPAQHGAFRVFFQPGGDEGGYAFLRGPWVGLSPGPFGVPVDQRAEDTPSRAPKGFSTRIEGRNVHATYALGSAPDCGQSLTPYGKPMLRTLDGHRTLVAFALDSSSDVCNPPGPQPNPRIAYQAGPLEPGPLRLRLHLHSEGMVHTGGWRVQETVLQV